MKTCTCCKMDKNKTEFGSNKTRTDGLQSWCKQCRSEYYRQNRTKILARISNNYIEHREERLSYAAQYVKDNKEMLSKKRRKYYLDHVEEYAEKHSKRYAIKRDEYIDRVKRWRRDNPDKLRSNARAWSHRRRARLVNASGSYSVSKFEELCDRANNCCLCCGKKTTLTIDHVIPLSRGGSNDIGNIQPLCLSCNCKKSDKTVDYREDVK